MTGLPRLALLFEGQYDVYFTFEINTFVPVVEWVSL